MTPEVPRRLQLRFALSSKTRLLRAGAGWIDAPSSKEYIIKASEPFGSYHRQQNNLPKAKKEFLHLGLVHSQVLQTTIRRLHDTWFGFAKRVHGFGASRNTVNSNPLCFLNSKTTLSRVSMSCGRRWDPCPSTCLAPFLMVLWSNRYRCCLKLGEPSGMLWSGWCARAVLVEPASAGCHSGVSCRPLNFSTTVYLRSCGVGRSASHQA